MDGMFIPYVNGNFITWLIDMLSRISVMSSARPSFSVATLWAPSHYYTNDNDVFFTFLPPSWSYRVENFNSAIFGDKVHALRTCITLLRKGTFNDADCTLGTTVSPELDMGYGAIIQPSYNNVLDSYTIDLNVDILDPSITRHITSSHMCVTVAHVSKQNSSISGSLVLYLDFPAAESCVLSHHLPVEAGLIYDSMAKMAIVMHARVAPWNCC